MKSKLILQLAVCIFSYSIMTYCLAEETTNNLAIESLRSEAYLMAQKQQYDLALPKLKQVVELSPQDPQSNYDYGAALFVSVQQFSEKMEIKFDNEAIPILQESVIYLKKAVDLFGNDDKSKFFKSTSCYLLGDIYHYGLIDLDKAEEMYHQALNIYPKNEIVNHKLRRLRVTKSKIK